MSKTKLQSLSTELFVSDELRSAELKELVDVIGGARPGTSYKNDCSDASSDQTGTNDACKWRADSNETNDTLKTSDGCNDLAATQILQAISNYVATSNGVVSGDLMGEGDEVTTAS